MISTPAFKKLSLQHRCKPGYPSKGWVIEAGGLGLLKPPFVGPGLALVEVQGAKAPESRAYFFLNCSCNIKLLLQVSFILMGLNKGKNDFQRILNGKI